MIVPFEYLVIGVLAVLVAALVAYGLAKWLTAKDTAIEDRRMGYIELASELDKAELDRTAEVFRRLAVGDYDRAFRAVIHLVKLLKEPGAILRLLERNFYWQLVERLKSDVDRPKIIAAVQDIIAADKAAKGRALAALKVQAAVEVAPPVPVVDAAGTVT